MPLYPLSVSSLRTWRRSCVYGYVQLHGEGSGKDGTKHGCVSSEEGAADGVSVDARHGGWARGGLLVEKAGELRKSVSRAA